MTENADVKWLRVVSDFGQEWLTKDRARRLLAHIDQLEADNNGMRGFIDHLKSKVSDQTDRRPTVHEIALEAMLAFISAGYNVNAASNAYDAAEALEAEGRRRDG